MKGTVGTKMMGNIEKANPKTISASQELHQPGSHMSIRKETAEISQLSSLLRTVHVDI